jgi:hypothetical protein
MTMVRRAYRARCAYGPEREDMMTERQRNLGDDDQVWADLSTIDDARLRAYSRMGVYKSMTGTVIEERARRYLAKMPPAISGSRGRATLWATVMTVVHGFDLEPEAAYELLRPWNANNQPPFGEHELQATCWRAHRKPGPRGEKLR